MRKQLTYIMTLIVMVKFVGAAFAAPPAPTNRLVSPYVISNSVIDPAWWPITEAIRVHNVCIEPVEVRHIGHVLIPDDEGVLKRVRILDEVSTIPAKGSWTRMFRHVIEESDIGVTMDEYEGDVTHTSRSHCLIGDNFRLDSSSLSGTNLYAPNGECILCDTLAQGYINSEHFTGELIINWAPSIGKVNRFIVAGYNEDGTVAGVIELVDIPQPYKVAFSDLGFPDDFKSGHLEVECPDSSCIVEFEFHSTTKDEHERPLLRESVPAWATCRPEVPGGNPRCEDNLVSVQTRGNLNCVVDQLCDVEIIVTGAEVLRSEPAPRNNIVAGVDFTLVEQSNQYRRYRLYGEPEETGLIEPRFLNACSNGGVSVSIGEEPPPECEDVVLVVDGVTVDSESDFSIELAVGDVADIDVTVVDGSLPIDVFGNLPKALVVDKANDFEYGIVGDALMAGTGIVTWKNACSAVDIPVTVREPECVDIVLQVSGDTSLELGDYADIKIDVVQGSLPITTSANLPDVLALNKLADSEYEIGGQALAEGIGAVLFENACSDASVSVMVTDTSSGVEGCTPGYWRQTHHYDSWFGFNPTDDFDDTFGRDALSPNQTLGQTITLDGGGPFNALVKHVTAALLNASSPDVDYAYSQSQVIAAFRATFDAHVVDGKWPAGLPTVEELKDIFADANEAGCPLN